MKLTRFGHKFAIHNDKFNICNDEIEFWTINKITTFCIRTFEINIFVVKYVSFNDVIFF